MLAPRVLALVLVAGCSPKVGIVRYRPSEVNLAPARAVSLSVDANKLQLGESLIDLAGLLSGGQRLDPKMAVEAVRSAVADRLTRDGFYALSPAGGAPAAIALEITAWGESVTSEKASDGRVAYKLDGQLRVEAALHRGAGAPVVRELRARESISADSKEDADARRPELMRGAAAIIAGQLAHLITPARYQDWVELDDSAGEVKVAVALIKDGKLDEAHAELSAIVQRAPESAAAHYNLGVIDEARGKLSSARERYERAHQLRPGPLTEKALERVQRASEECRALQCSDQ